MTTPKGFLWLIQDLLERSERTRKLAIDLVAEFPLPLDVLRKLGIPPVEYVTATRISLIVEANDWVERN